VQETEKTEKKFYVFPVQIFENRNRKYKQMPP